MATVKSYTDLDQCKRLKEILNEDTADLWWDTNEFEPRPEKHYRQYLGMMIDPIPCWSLAVLLNIIPKHIRGCNVLRIDIGEKDFSIWYDEIGCGVANTELPDITKESAVDACVEMIVKLHEQKLL